MDPWKSSTWTLVLLGVGWVGGRVGPLDLQVFAQSLLKSEPMPDITEGCGVWTAVGPPWGGVGCANHEWHPAKRGQQEEWPRGQGKGPRAGM